MAALDFAPDADGTLPGGEERPTVPTTSELARVSMGKMGNPTPAEVQVVCACLLQEMLATLQDVRTLVMSLEAKVDRIEEQL